MSQLKSLIAQDIQDKNQITETLTKVLDTYSSDKPKSTSAIKSGFSNSSMLTESSNELAESNRFISW